MGKDQELLDAARHGNVALIEKIFSQRKLTAGLLALPLPTLPSMRKGAHPNCQDSNGETPLHLASLNGHKEVVELLLKLQASANIPDQKGCFPLHMSAWSGKADVCRILLTLGPSIAKVNNQNLDGDTALHSAAQYGHNQVVDILLQNHADPALKNNKGEKALDLAIQYGRLETVQLLLNADKVSHEHAADDRSPLLLAAKNGHKQVLQLLLDDGFDINQTSKTGTVLHEACMYGRLEIAKFLLEKGIDVNIKDNEDKTAIDLLNFLNTPISLEILKTINEHVNSTKVGQKSDRLSTSSELDYDYLPPGSRPVKQIDTYRDRLPSQDSLASSNQQISEEESIYDHPRTIQNILENSTNVTSSFRNDLPLNSPDTPKKPPRKRPPQSVLVKSTIFPDRMESNNGSTDTLSLSSHVGILTTCVPTTSANSDATDFTSSTIDNQTSSMAVGASTCIDNKQPNNNKMNCADNNNKLFSSGTNDNKENKKVTKELDKTRTPINPKDKPPTSERPPTLNLIGSKPSIIKEIPLSPSNYEQPPTPEHPPPSPMTAILGIQEKINPKERRRSRDMETITDTEYLAAMTNGATPPSSTDNSLPSAAESSRLSAADNKNDAVLVANKNQYHGLTMGSSASGQRRVKSQILDNVYNQGSRRTSVPHFGTGFDPVIERVEEQESFLQASSRVSSENNSNRLSQRSRTNASLEGKERVSTPDETEEWAKIEDLITSIGGGLDADMLVKQFDELMSNVLPAAGGVKVQSVGDWLESLDLAQYENCFIANGFDNMDFMGPDVLEEADLQEIGITDTNHRQKILEAASKLPPMKPFNESQHSVKEWLESIHLSEYLETLIKHGFHDLKRIKKLWEVELTSILDISMLGHRKRILASLKHTTDATKRNSFPDSEITDSLNKQIYIDQNMQLLNDLTPGHELDKVSLFKDYTNLTSLHKGTKKNTTPDKAEGEVSGDTEDTVNENAGGGSGDGNGKEVEKENERAGNENIEAAFSHWCHKPETLIKGCCNYNVQYLGSTLVTVLDGTESTKASISKFKRSTENITKVPNIILSISYRGVKFIDAKSKRVICEHEIGNIFCACQDGDSLNFFAYITRDLVSDKHYCHVFTVNSTSLATEIILTLGEAFEVAYQIAVTECGQQVQGSNPDIVPAEDESAEIHGVAADSLEELPTINVHSTSYSTAI